MAEPLQEKAYPSIRVEPGIHEIRRLSLRELKHIPRIRPLRRLLGVWIQAKLRRGALPNELPATAVCDCQMLHNIHVYDVSRPNLADAFVSVWGTHAVIYRGLSQAAQNLRPIPNEGYMNWVLAALFFVRCQGQPYLEHVVTERQPLELAYSRSRYRLLLPLSSDGQRVNRIITAWVFVP